MNNKLTVGAPVVAKITTEHLGETRNHIGIVESVYPRFIRIKFKVHGNTLYECYSPKEVSLL